MALGSRSLPLRSLYTVHATVTLRRGYASTSVLLNNDAPSNSTIPVFRDLSELRPLRRTLYANNRQVGFVPTMGALHDGHISLVKRALSENSDIFVSIYVNPTQFGVNEDLDKYPKTWEADMARLKELNQEARRDSGVGNSHGTIAGVFAPTTQVMYPTLPPSSEIDGEGSFVTITPMGRLLEGTSRPVFFRGVATVCTKLFNAVQPDKVYFGQKDIQQSVLIRRMVKDFLIPTEVVVVPTERESDGLAMSSRNVYLGQRRRNEVAVLSQALFAAKKRYEEGERSVGSIRKAAFDVFSKKFGGKGGETVFSAAMKVEIDYIALSDMSDMSSVGDAAQVDPKTGAILSAAIKVWPVSEPQNDEERGQIAVRLIDNVILDPR